MKIILGLFLLFAPAHAYKFLCNSITAEGKTGSDSCGPCTAATGPRWPNNLTSYNVSTQQIPAGVSSSEWLNLVQSSFDSWTAVPGVQLGLNYVGEGTRSFGVDYKNHDIFWTQDEVEWMDEVGAAPNGILGVTLPSYYCPNSSFSYRLIGDADMILNAVPSAGFSWASGCAQLSESCQSIRGTMSHEMGHFLGLGHPFALGQALMSAQAGFLIEYPLFDDQQGILALYPASVVSGAMGAKCAVDSECQAGLTCHSQGGSQYCSLGTCTSNLACENHMLCQSNGFCEYPSGKQLGAVGLHEDCSVNSCDTALICVQVSADSAYCFAACTQDKTSCATHESCHQLHNSKHEAIDEFACIQEVKAGESCGKLVACQAGFACTAGICVIRSKTSIEDVSTPPVLTQPDSMESVASCSSVQGQQPEIGLLLCLMGILIHRPKKKC